MDPIDIIEKITGNRIKDCDNLIESSSIVLFQIKKTLRDMVMEINGDFSSHSVSCYDFISRVKLQGFEEIYSKDFDITRYNENFIEKEVILSNYQYGILCTVFK